MSEAAQDFDVPTVTPAKPSSRRGGGTGKGRTRKVDAVAALRTRIAEAIAEMGSWIEPRDAELGRALIEDADKMAALMAAWALHPKSPPPVAFAIKLVAAILEPFRAFGRTFRILLGRLAERRAERAEYADEQGETPYAAEPIYAEPNATPEPQVAEPWRIDDGLASEAS